MDSVVAMNEDSSFTVFEADFKKWQQQVYAGPRLYEPLIMAMADRSGEKRRLVHCGYGVSSFDWVDSKLWEVISQRRSLDNREGMLSDLSGDAINSASAVFCRVPNSESKQRFFELTENAWRALVDGGVFVLEDDFFAENSGTLSSDKEALSLLYYTLWRAGFQNISIVERESLVHASTVQDAKPTNFHQRSFALIGQKNPQCLVALSARITEAIGTIRAICSRPHTPFALGSRFIASSGLGTQELGVEEIVKAYSYWRAEARTAEQTIAALSESAFTARDFARRLLKAERRILDLRIKVSILSPLTYPWTLFASKILRLVQKSREKRRARPQSSTSTKQNGQPDPDVHIGSPPSNTATSIGEQPRILVLKLDHIGDLLLAFPAVEILRRAWPKGHFTLVCSPANESLAESSKLFDRVISHKFTPNLSEERSKSNVNNYGRIQDVIEGSFDLAVDLRHDPDTRPHLAFIDSAIKAGFQSQGKHYTPLDISLSPMSQQAGMHATTHNLHRLMLLANHIVNSLTPIPFTAAGRNLVVSGRFNLPVTVGDYVVFAPGGGTRAKKWPVESFVQLVRMLIEKNDVTIVLIGGMAETDYGTGIHNSIEGGRVFDLIGKLPLTDLASVISGAAAFVGTDTGATHLAALLGVPTISVFSGVADISVWRPVGENVSIIHAKVGCAPCQISRLEQCVADHACMMMIEPAVVYRELMKRARLTHSARG